MSSILIKSAFNDKPIQYYFDRLAERGANMKPAFQSIGESMLISTEDRFRAERDPNGNPWEPLSDKYARRKKGPKILTQRNRLRNSIIYRASNDQVAWGTNVIYAAIHQFGGTIEHAARSQQAYFKQNKRTGEVGNRFVKKARSNFSQWVTIGAYSTTMPARPYLGISDDDKRHIVRILREHLIKT